MAGSSDQGFSELVYTILDCTGVNADIKNVRSELIQQIETIALKFTDRTGTIITGSTSEGLFPFLRSDFDMMVYHNDVICVENSNGETNINTLQPDFNDSPPGYTKLLAVHLGNNRETHITSKFCSMSCTYASQTKHKYISSSLFRHLCEQHWKKVLRVITKCNFAKNTSEISNGPALTTTNLHSQTVLGNVVGGFTSEIDHVTALLFYNSDILDKWASRTRNYDWPSEAVIKEVKSTEGFILPIGEKESENQMLEWRISYVTAEKKLLSTFNSTQDKLYALLKMLAKELLVPLCKNFSSYIVKNIVLWISERNPSSHFVPELLLDGLLQCLAFTKQCLQNNYLPNYIIPERNLISGRIVGLEKEKLIYKINSLLEEGISVVLKIPRVAKYVYHAKVNPGILERYCTWRNEVEKVIIADTMVMCEHLNTDMFFSPTGRTDLVLQYVKDGRSLELTFKLVNLLVPDWMERLLQGQSFALLDLLNARMKAILSDDVIPG